MQSCHATDVATRVAGKTATPDLIARAEALEVQFNALQAEVAEKNASLANRTAAFNQQQSSFQTGCQAYFAQN